MEKVVYIVSDRIDHSKLICDDAGPGYAASMGWGHVALSAFRVSDGQVVVVDNRIQEGEFDSLKELIGSNKNTRFFLKIVDPCNEHRGESYYNFLFDAVDFGNVFLLSTYQPKELAAELAGLYKDRFIHLPYPYIRANEIEPEKSRKNKILISGAMNRAVYPYRYGIWLKVTRSVSRVFFKILKHPGYAEVSDTGKHIHTITGKAYINYLSDFKYMLLCPSRCFIELLKFNECAYAGCIPVGIAPDSYPTEIKHVFLKLDLGDFYSRLFSIILGRYDAGKVETLREYLRATRNPKVLNEAFKKFIIEHPLHTS